MWQIIKIVVLFSYLLLNFIISVRAAIAGREKNCKSLVSGGVSSGGGSRGGGGSKGEIKDVVSS